MSAYRRPVSPRRNPDGDSPLRRRVLVEGKHALQRRLAPTGTSVVPPESPYLVVPILGQSNAVGMGLGLDLDGADRPHPCVHQWAMCGPSKDTAILAVEPLLHGIPARGADETGRAVLLIPGARGDTSFAPKNGYTWDPADTSTRNNLHHRAVKAIDTVLARYPGSQLAAILWHQGETDVPLTPGPVYAAHLDSLIDDLRDRYGSEVPFLLGQMTPEEMEQNYGAYSTIDAVHADTPNRRPRTAFVPGPKFSINGGTDRHYNAAGQRELGQRMWDTYRAMCIDELVKYGVR
jgi:Carbohydrate esterase, sialic acid-specific acetylesterase